MTIHTISLALWLLIFCGLGFYPGVKITYRGGSVRHFGGPLGMFLAPLLVLFIGFFFFLFGAVLTLPIWIWWV